MGHARYLLLDSEQVSVSVSTNAGSSWPFIVRVHFSCVYGSGICRAGTQRALALEAIASETDDPSQKVVKKSRLVHIYSVFEALVAFICPTRLCTPVYGVVVFQDDDGCSPVFCANLVLLGCTVLPRLVLMFWTRFTYILRISRMLFALGRRLVGFSEKVYWANFFVVRRVSFCCRLTRRVIF